MSELFVLLSVPISLVLVGLVYEQCSKLVKCLKTFAAKGEKDVC